MSRASLLVSGGPTGDVFLSAASAWEIAIKAALGKLSADVDEVVRTSFEVGFDEDHAGGAQIALAGNTVRTVRIDQQGGAALRRADAGARFGIDRRGGTHGQQGDQARFARD